MVGIEKKPNGNMSVVKISLWKEKYGVFYRYKSKLFGKTVEPSADSNQIQREDALTQRLTKVSKQYLSLYKNVYTLNAFANVDCRAPGLAKFPNSYILDMSDAVPWSICPGPIKIEISYSNLDGLASVTNNPSIMRYGGSYEKSDKVHNGAPVYRKKGVIGNRMYLYTYDNGTWNTIHD